MKYKIVVLPDGREIKAQDNHRWMAMDHDGRWYSYLEKPKIVESIEHGGVWINGVNGCSCTPMNLTGPFEPGDWTEQRYWIGD